MGVREKIRNRQIVAGTMVRIVRNPAIAYIAKEAGLDFILFDCEHSDYSLETIHDIALTAGALGISVMARVPNLSKEYISRMLDNGVEGVMVPMIENAQQVHELVKYAKYTPVGSRGFTAIGPHTGFAGGAHNRIMEHANDNVMVIAQIETASAVDHIDEIAAVDGLDALLIGPNDLSIALGVPGDITNPVELDAISKVADAAETHGKLFALHSGPGLSDRFAHRLGFVIQSTDFDCLKAGFSTVRAYADTALAK